LILGVVVWYDDLLSHYSKYLLILQLTKISARIPKRDHDHREGRQTAVEQLKNWQSSLQEKLPKALQCLLAANIGLLRSLARHEDFLVLGCWAIFDLAVMRCLPRVGHFLKVCSKTNSEAV